MRVADFLLHGQSNAVSQRQLVTWTGLDGRTLRRAIEHERRSGIPICADNQTGYYLPSSEDEKAACVRSMRHRAREIARTADALAAAELEADDADT